MPQASADSLASGVSFGSYVVRELIGRGGMASVYRAEHLLLNKPVALKVMERSLLATAGARQRFVLEGRAAAAIKHPNVVDITDVGVHDDVPFLVMELLTGEDLDAHLKRRGPLDESATVRLALPIILALNTAHASGVVHRDIKPSNIFLSQGADDQIVPKVLDFGISKVTFENSKLDLSLTPHHQVMGTPRYLPPEALQGARELGPASDQFSLGVVLYECVTGNTPFAGETLLALLNALSAGAFRPARELAPAISVGLDRVIMRAISPQPGDRFPTIRDMGRALLDLAAERTQMVWGHSFRGPGEDNVSSKFSRVPPLTEPIDRLSVPSFQRYRGLAFGTAFICIGALASALASALLQSGRAPVADASDPGRREPGVSVAALASSVEVPARPAPPPSLETKQEGAPPEAHPPERVRPIRSQIRRAPSWRVARRSEATAARVEEHPALRQPAAAVGGATTSGPSGPAPGPAAAPANEERDALPATRRQGANGSPLLD